MAHNIWRNEQGEDAMFVVGDRAAAWHHLGQRCVEAANWEEAMQLARLDWTVDLKPIFFNAGQSKLIELIEVPRQFAVVRSIDNAPLGVVGNVYHPIQNREAFKFVDSLLEVSNGAHYDSAGALGNGERIWCLARIPSADFTIGQNDQHQQYVLFTTSHDGSGSATAKITSTRVVCNNTLTSALHGAGAFLKIRHTKDGQRRLAAAEELMQNAVMDAAALKGKFELLTQRQMSKETVMRIVDRLFPVETDEKKLAESAGLRAAVTRRDNVLTQILGVYDNADNGVQEFKGSAYHFLNAFTEWTDHVKGANQRGVLSPIQNRAQQAMFGTGADFKSEAMVAILEETDPEVQGRATPDGHQAYIDAEVKKLLG